jgi:predicted RNA-binding protein
MCESNAYLIREGKEELLMESVSSVKPQGELMILRNLFGEETRVQARLLEVDLTGHKILLRAE